MVNPLQDKSRWYSLDQTVAREMEHDSTVHSYYIAQDRVLLA